MRSSGLLVRTLYTIGKEIYYIYSVSKLISISFQAIIMVGKQCWNNFMEYLFPKFWNWWRQRKHKQVSSKRKGKKRDLKNFLLSGH